MPPGSLRKRRNHASRFWANWAMSDQSSQSAITPQIASTIMSTNKWRERPTTRGSFRRRKYFLIEPTVVVAAMRSSGKAGDTGNPPENHRRRTLDQVKGFAIIE